MAAFFPDVLDKFLTSDFLEHVREKFHYGETRKVEFQAVAEEMLPLMRKEPFFLEERQAEKNSVIYENVVISLGKALDDLQENYSKKGLLSESYIVEVLASEVLMRGYEAYNRYVRENTDWHVAKYHFPGSEEAFPIDMLPQLLQKVTLQVTCNDAFCMQPKKSVAFVAELTQDEKVQCQGICVGCHNIQCLNRVEDNSPEHKRLSLMADMPLTYGYSRIFGVN